MARDLKAFDLSETELLILGAIGIGVFVMMKGGFANAFQAIGAGAVDAVTGAAVGAVDATGQTIGLPALSDITTDPYVARYVMDHPDGGYLSASKWSSAAALVQAGFLDQYSGHVPPAGSKIYAVFPPSSGGW